MITHLLTSQVEYIYSERGSPLSAMCQVHLTHRGTLWEMSETDESGMCGHAMINVGEKFFGIADESLYCQNESRNAE